MCSQSSVSVHAIETTDGQFGQTQRQIHSIILDDWLKCCTIVHSAVGASSCFVFVEPFWFFWCAIQSTTRTVISWLIAVQCIVSKLKSFWRTRCALKNYSPTSVLALHFLFASVCLHVCFAAYAVVSNNFIGFFLKMGSAPTLDGIGRECFYQVKLDFIKTAQSSLRWRWLCFTLYTVLSLQNNWIEIQQHAAIWLQLNNIELILSKKELHDFSSITHVRRLNLSRQFFRSHDLRYFHFPSKTDLISVLFFSTILIDFFNVPIKIILKYCVCRSGSRQYKSEWNCSNIICLLVFTSMTSKKSKVLRRTKNPSLVNSGLVRDSQSG